MFNSASMKKADSQSGMTLIEIIIVISLMAMVYAMAAPDLMLSRDAEMRLKVNKVMEDIRAAYDLTVLTGKHHRLVFQFESGEYWLEETDAEDFKLASADDGRGRDLTSEEEKDEQELFEDSWKEYEDLAGEQVQDPSDDSFITPSSPLLKARGKLKPPTWAMVKTGEWSVRAISPELTIAELHAEHHPEPQSFESTGEGGRGVLYFFPQGYVERAVIKIAELNSDGTIDQDRKPITLITEPLEGTGREINDEQFDMDEYLDAQRS